jgi:hypothetical protein
MFHSSESNFTGRAVPGWWSRRSSHGVSGQRYSGKKDLPRIFSGSPIGRRHLQIENQILKCRTFPVLFLRSVQIIRNTSHYFINSFTPIRTRIRYAIEKPIHERINRIVATS